METTSRRVGIGHHVSTRVPHGPGVGGEGKEEQGQSQQMLNSQVRDPPPPPLPPPPLPICSCAMAGIGCHKSPRDPYNPGLGGEEGGVGCWTGAVLYSTASARWTQVAPQPVSLSLPMRSYPIADIGHHVSMRGLCGLGVGGKGEEVGGQRQSLYPTATHCV